MVLPEKGEAGGVWRVDASHMAVDNSSLRIEKRLKNLEKSKEERDSGKKMRKKK